MNSKQRGVYSEILVTEDNQMLKEASTVGPQKTDKVIKANPIQKIPRAMGIKRREKLLNKNALVDPNSKILGKSYFFRNPEVNTGYYTTKREGVADVDPKVMEPYIPIKDHPPRKVVIDRQRKLFASLSIEELLLELGVDYSDTEQKTEEWLPLEPFDDSEYDCRTPQEWIKCGKIDENTYEPIPGKALWKDENGAGHWRKVLIYKYDDEKDIYEGIWEDSTKNKCEVSRINLLFDAEDPRIFAQRVAKAHRDRKFADSQMRYNLLVLHMPTEDLYELDSEQISRIKNMAENRQAQSKEAQGKDSGKDGAGKLKMSDQLLAEINKNYARTLNKIILDKARENPEGKEIIDIDFTLPEPSDNLIYKSSLAEGPSRQFNSKAPFFGLIPIPNHDFPKKFSDFCFNSLYIKPEVFEAMVDIRATCLELMEPSKNVFDCNINKTIRLEEFKQLQGAVNAQIKFATRDQWIKNITTIINDNFSNVGKGWFNILETSKETYEFGKLKKFLTTVNFMMQDTVLVLCKNSVYEFEKFVLKFIPLSTEITSSSEVVNVFEHPEKEAEGEAEGEAKEEKDDESEDGFEDDEDEDKDPIPLFVLDLVMKQGQELPQYSTDPQEVVSTVMDIFDQGIKALQEIPQLEPILLKHLFLKSHGNKSLKAPMIPHSKPEIPEKKHILPDENTWLWDCYENILNSLSTGIEPLKQYLDTFGKFKEETQLNPDKYVRGLDDYDNPASVDEIKADIEKHKKESNRILNEIPDNVIVSYFKVNCKDIRKLFSSRHDSIVDKEIKLIAQRARDKNNQLSLKFEEMEAKIRKTPNTIEELQEIKDYMAALPVEVETQKIEIKDCMEIYDLLEDFQFEFPMSELDSKWELFSAPKRLME